MRNLIMIPGTKKTVLFLLGVWIWASSGTALAVLTTDELTRLKASNLGESVIRLMIESDYDNVERVTKLKQAGFSDETITSVIRGDLKAGSEAKRPTLRPEQPALPPEKVEPLTAVTAPVAEAKVSLQTSAKVTIEQYIAVGDPVVQNGQEIRNATISLLEGRRMKIGWNDSKPSGLMTFLRGKPFASPFYWDLDKSDGLHSVNSKDGSFTLQTGYSHPGQPPVDRSRYWVVHVSPENPDLVRRIRELLSE
jgi:hypothetical protein